MYSLDFAPFLCFLPFRSRILPFSSRIGVCCPPAPHPISIEPMLGYAGGVQPPPVLYCTVLYCTVLYVSVQAVCSPHLYKHRMARIGETCLISLYVLPAILLSIVFNIPR